MLQNIKTCIAFAIISLLISANLVSQNPIKHKGEAINYVDENGMQQGIWKIYAPNEDRAPRGKVYLECKFIDGIIEGHIIIKNGKKTIIEINPIPKDNKASFKAIKDSKEITGYISIRNDKPEYWDVSGNKYTGEEQKWMRKHTAFLPMHYNGASGVQKNISETFNPKNVKGEKGRVYTYFIVDENGYINDPKVAETRKTTPNTDGLLEKEALRIVKSFPRMQPAFQGYRFIKISYTVPINF